ncbi:PH domain-containing protein [Cryobacterium sp. MLB-32]|uniref:PH domain-containing protein n=1 Tax=Cryobacterium sp. MLB-32 TaxID=1529318 RepID=UPI00056C3EE0|nr:PH domain-containing protein [Cryobacterium sp. MLB-32]
MTPATDPDTYVSRFNRTLAGIVVALCAVSAVALSLTGQELFLIPTGFIVLLCWVYLWAPSVCVSDRAVTVRNPLRTIEIPWAALVQVDTKFSLTLFTPGRRWPVWVAPAPGRGTVRRANRAGESVDRTRFMTVEPRPGDLPGTESGDAAQLVRNRWDRLQATGAIEAGVAEQTPVTLIPHRTIAALLVVFAVGSAAAILLG